MQFTSSLITILSLTSSALTAPTSLISTPVVNINPYIPSVPSKLGNSITTLGHSITALRKRQYVSLNASSPIVTISSSVALLQSTIAGDIQSLNSLSAAGASAAGIESSLWNIATAINSTISTISPAVKGSVGNVGAAEISELMAALQQVGAVVNGVESGLMDVLAVITDEIRGTIKTPIIKTLSLITPLTNPLTSFAFGVAGTVASSNGTTAEDIRYAAEVVVNAAMLLVSPVGPVLDSLL